MARDYDALEQRFDDDVDRATRLRVLTDALWEGLRATGVSWVGFYLAAPGDPVTELVLGPSRNTPACSPIGMQGVCGQGFTRRQTVIIDDVARLGDAYIACDPRDRSEIVVPLLDESGAAWAVLDLDSHETSSFDERDAAGLGRVLTAAGFRVPDQVHTAGV